MRHLATLALLAAAPAIAQTSFSIDAPNTTTISAAVGAQSHTESFGGGLPLPIQSSAMVDLGALGSATTVVTRHVDQDPSEVRCTLGLSGNVASSTSASVDVPVHDYLLTFHTAATTGMVRFTFERTFTATAGAPAPTLVIDLFDDGIIEATGTASTPQSYDTFVFFAPIRIRVRVGASVSTSVAPAASFQLGLNVRAVPLNGVQALPALPGCGGNALQVRPAWDVDGVVLRLSPVLWQGFPYLAVFGLGTSMLTLGPPPAITPLQACVLMPSPDVVLLMPPSGEMLLPIPAAVRPIAIFTQAVVFTGSVTSLQTTDASLVLAN